MLLLMSRLCSDRSNAEPMNIESEVEKPEFIKLDGIPKGVAQRRNSEVDEDPEAEQDLEVEETKEQQTKQKTPTTVVRRSTRITRPPQHFLPSLFHILLTDGGEPETYDEALEVENSTKWELAMKDEIDSLMTNRT
jgi:hypothetical protein